MHTQKYNWAPRLANAKLPSQVCSRQFLQPYEILNFRRRPRRSPPTPNVNVGNAQNHGSEKKMLLLNIEIRGRGRGVSVGDVRSGSEVKYFVGSLYLKD